MCSLIELKWKTFVIVRIFSGKVRTRKTCPNVEKREKRTKHASLVLGESQLNAGASEMERSEGSANAFDVSNRRSVDFIFFLCRDRE